MIDDARYSQPDIENQGADRSFKGFPMREMIGYDGTVLRRVKVDSNGNLIIGEVALPTGASTSTKQDTQTTLLQGIAGLVPSQYDYIAMTYTGDNLTGVVFKVGGSNGTIVATLTLDYTGAVLNSVTKS